jgi:hypothetical protein
MVLDDVSLHVSRVDGVGGAAHLAILSNRELAARLAVGGSDEKTSALLPRPRTDLAPLHTEPLWVRKRIYGRTGPIWSAGPQSVY